MAFNELGFLFIFFPAALLLCLPMPKIAKNAMLVLVSLVFFAWGSAEYVVILLLSILFNYFSGLQLEALQTEEKPAQLRIVIWSAVAVNLLLLGFFKYWGFVLENINALLGTAIPIRALPMPLGVSFFTFSALSYLFDVYRGKSPAAKNIVDFALYISFFPKLVSGPIVTYATFARQAKRRKVSLAKFSSGCRLFLVGLAKKVLLSNTIGVTFNALTALPGDAVSVVSAWIGAIAYALMLYFDFSGYSDMAIGLSRMYGFRFDDNFDHPYASESLTEFWRRWHISLGAWFRDYVYIPLGGSRVGTAKTIRNLMVVWLLTGIWHGANWTFIVWGLYHGLLLLAEKFVLKNVLKKAPHSVKVILTFLLVLIGWVFFFSPSLGSAFAWLGKMFGAGAAGFLDGTAKYYLGSSWFVLLIGMIGAFPAVGKAAGNLCRGKAGTAVTVVWFALLLMLCIAGMTSSTYSSFLYFQF